MRTHLIALAFVLTVATAAAQTAPPPVVAPIPASVQANVERLQKAALGSDLAYDIVEGLTTEIGPRLAGSDAEARARAWAVAMLRRNGFQNVRIEPFTIPYWERKVERATVITPNGRQNLVVVALGGSPATPAAGVEAEVARFASIAALNDAAPGGVRGKIVFIDETTIRTQDGAGYGAGVAKRGQCGMAAYAKGAVACIIRSVGTHSHRFAHQGGSTTPRPAPATPSAAVSPPDADQLTRLLARGAVRVKLEIAVETREIAQSGNVVGEIVGRERPEEIIVIGGHLDSWDQGTGAIDDGAGVAITTAAAKLVRDLPRRPRRTIRVVLFGAEETGIHGGTAYARQHASELDKHIVAAESDFGAREIYRMRSRFGEGALPYARAIQRALAPLRINAGDNTANGGPDVGPLRPLGVPMVELSQNGWDYFDYHHTPDDTLDKIDRAELRQNVAAYATFIYLAAEMDWDFRKPADTPAPAAR
ncbi:MAG: M20/M25/M40 family metallo-hydrolase [Alphaproteobacteria bacterium]|nr:M20/M25/M40 family metallo-hydrolase [Alphaproteobacteria bacterium]